jgi:hypothetical protein
VDRICWIPPKRHKFEVKLYYHVLTIPTRPRASCFLERVFGELSFESGIPCLDSGIRENIGVR